MEQPEPVVGENSLREGLVVADSVDDIEPALVNGGAYDIPLMSHIKLFFHEAVSPLAHLACHGVGGNRLSAAGQLVYDGYIKVAVDYQ